MPDAEDVEAGAVLRVQLQRFQNVAFDIGGKLDGFSNSNMASTIRFRQLTADVKHKKHLLFLPRATASALKAA